MPQEEKQLLTKDLCARLPYGVKIQIYDDYSGLMKDEKLNVFHLDGTYSIEYRKLRPYLRSMSSMTKEEEDDLRMLNRRLIECNEDDDEKFYGIVGDIHNFYYSRHIDCNSLIEKGLALEAPEGMYKTE